MSDYFYSLYQNIQESSFDKCWRDMDWFMEFLDHYPNENNQ